MIGADRAINAAANKSDAETRSENDANLFFMALILSQITVAPAGKQSRHGLVQTLIRCRP
jgi:hypothetical protein